MKSLKLLTCLLALISAFSLTSSGYAQTYPSRDITFIVPFGAGGSTDVISRQFAAQLEEVLGGNINVENRPGGSGTIGADLIMRADPDGYTIGIVPSEVLTYQPLVHPELSWQTPEDYQPIVKLGNRPSILFVRGDAPWASFEDFLNEARSNPGKIRAAVPGVGTLSDLVVQQLNRVADVEIVTVPFTGGGSEAVVALLGDRVEAFIGSISGNLGQVQAGKLRALAAFQEGQNEVVPEATSVIDAGYNVTLQVAFYVVAPKGLNEDALEKLTSASLEVARSEEFAEFAARNDLSLDVLAPEEAKAALNDLTEDFVELLPNTGQQ